MGMIALVAAEAYIAEHRIDGSVSRLTLPEIASRPREVLDVAAARN
jgi:hypothetical protein